MCIHYRLIFIFLVTLCTFLVQTFACPLSEQQQTASKRPARSGETLGNLQTPLALSARSHHCYFPPCGHLSTITSHDANLSIRQESLLLVTGPYLYTYAPKRLTYIPKEMDVYYGTELSAVVHTNYTPLRENPHLEPRFQFKYQTNRSPRGEIVKTTLNSDDNEHVEPKTALLRMFQTWTKAFHWVSASPGAACLAPTCLVLSPLRLPAISHGHGRSVCGLSVSPSGAPGHFTRPGAATFSPTFSLTMLHEAPAKSRNGRNDRCEHTDVRHPNPQSRSIALARHDPYPPLPPLLPPCSLPPPSASALDRLDHLNHDRDQQVERFNNDLAAQVGAERARE